MEDYVPAIHLVYEELGLFAARGVLVLVDVFLCVSCPKQLLGIGCTCYMIRPGPCMKKEGSYPTTTEGFSIVQISNGRAPCASRSCAALCR